MVILMDFNNIIGWITVSGLFGIMIIILFFYIVWCFIKSAVYHGAKQAVTEALREVLADTGDFEYRQPYTIHDTDTNTFKIGYSSKINKDFNDVK